MTSTIPKESIRKRYGRLRISREILDRVIDRTSSNAQAAWNAMMMDFVILRTDHCMSTLSMRYEGFHPKFDELPEHTAFEPPEYDAQISQHIEDHNITTFEVTMLRRST